MPLSLGSEQLRQHDALIASAVVILAAFFIRYVFVSLKNPYWQMPGPWYTRFTSLAMLYHDLHGERPRWVQSLHEQYGPVVRVSPDYVDIADVVAARKIHSVGHGFCKAPWYELVGGGAINLFTATNKDIHRQHRRLLSAPMSDSSLRALEPVVRAKTELWSQQLDRECCERGAVDIFKWNMFFTTDVIGELTFGKSFGMLENGEKNQYIHDLESTSVSDAISTTFPLLYQLVRLLRLPVPYIRSAVDAHRRVKSYSLESIARYRTLVSEDPESAPPTLFRKLYDANDDNEKQGTNQEEKQTFSDQELQDEARGYIIAGSDTTSSTLTYLIWTVSRRPEIRDRLLKELSGLPEGWTDQNLRELPYFGRLINETLRLYSAAPLGLRRVVPPGGAQLAGWQFPEGKLVTTQAYSMHRIPEIFEHPEEFTPDRWENPTQEMRDGFMPFGGGARVCIGLNLAKIELRLAAALFFLKFPDSQPSTLEGMSEADMKEAQYLLLTPMGNRCLMELK